MMRSLDQMSSGSSSCSPVLSDDSFESPTRMFGHVSSPVHSTSGPFASRHLLMPAHPINYLDQSLPSTGLDLSSPSSRFGLSLAELPVHNEQMHSMFSDRLSSFDQPITVGHINAHASDINVNVNTTTNHIQSNNGNNHSINGNGNDTNGNTNGSADFGRSTRGKIKICGVCGDRAKSFHFGAISCDSCKAFFRRSVQNEAYKNFHCPYNNRCDITILSRKCCQHCRFDKCISVGMEKSWVMSEEERLQLLRTRLQRKQAEQQQRQMSPACGSTSRMSGSITSGSSYTPEYSQIYQHLQSSEIEFIEQMVNNYLMCCVRMRPSFLGPQVLPKSPLASNRLSSSASSSSSSSSMDHIQAENQSQAFQLFFSCVHQFTSFARRFAPFQQLTAHDQQLLLRQAVLELSCLRAAFNYDAKRNVFTRTALTWSPQAADRWDEPCECADRFDRFDRLSRSYSMVNNRLESMDDELPPLCKCRLSLLRCERVPVVRASVLQPLLGAELHHKLMRFVRALNECAVDEPVLLLLCSILLLSGERSGIRQTQLVNAQQDACVRLLQKYMHWKHGPEAHGPLMARLLLTLPELRELTDLFADCPLEQLQHQHKHEQQQQQHEQQHQHHQQHQHSQHRQRLAGSCSTTSSSTGSGSECDGCESDCCSRSGSPSDFDFVDTSNDLQHQLNSLALNQTHGSTHERSQLILQHLDDMVQEGQTKLFSIQESVAV